MQSQFFGLAFTSIAIMMMSSCGEMKSSKIMGAQAGKANINKPVYVRVPHSMLTKDWVQSTGFNRDHANNSEFAVGWLPAESYKALSFTEQSRISTIDELAVAEGRFNPFTMQSINLPVEFQDGEKFEDYHNYQALTAELRSLADAHPEIAKLTSVGKTVQNRDIWMMTISDQVEEEEGEPELLYIANMHGDEVVGRELSIYHLRRLLNEYGSNSRVTNLVNNSKMFVIASMNPDGFELRQRYNAESVDLNRDFPDFTSDNNDTPVGRAIETKGIMDLHASHHFVASVNFHGGEVCFNLPWDTKTNNPISERFGDDAVLSSMGRAWADSNPTMVANTGFDRGLTYGYEWYEVNGGMQDWSIFYRQSMHATVELSYSKWPQASYLATAWRENQEAMLAYHERALTGVHVQVVDSQGRNVPSFDLSVESANRSITYTQGFAHRTTTEGPQRVQISIGGRTVAHLTTNARPFDGTFTRIVIASQDQH